MTPELERQAPDRNSTARDDIDDTQATCEHCGREPDEANGILVGIPLGGDTPTCNICIEEHADEHTYLGTREAQAIAYKLLGKSNRESGRLIISREDVDADTLTPGTAKNYANTGIKKGDRALETYLTFEPLLSDRVTGDYDEATAPTTCEHCESDVDRERGIVVNYPLVGVDDSGELERDDEAICNRCLEEYLDEETFLAERQSQVAAYRLLGLTHEQIATELRKRFGDDAPSTGAIHMHNARAREKAQRGLETYLVLEPLLEARRGMPQYQD